MLHPLAAILVLCSAATAAAGSGDAIGSVNVYGSARLGSADAPTGATVFDGQTLSTATRSRALVTLASAASVSLGPNSEATLRRTEISLARGAARFQSGESGSTRFFADALELRPTTPGTKVDASLVEGGKVNIAVATGAVDVIAPTGARLHRIAAGQAFLFGMAQSAPQADSQAQPPQGRSGGQAPGVEDQPQKKTNRTALWILLGAGAAGGGAAAALGGGKRGS